MTAKLEGPTDSHSLALVGGSKGKANSNPSTRMFTFSSLMSMPDEEFDDLGEDELALLMRRFKRLHENPVNMRRNTRTCFQCGKPGHFIADFQVEVLFRLIFLCEFVPLDQRSVWVKFGVVLVFFARCSWLEFVARYMRLDRPW
jgi:hypothetical protein